jgi:uncharacterized membrane protein
MIKITTSTIINRPHQDIFAYITNFENNPKWQGGMVEAKFTSEGPLQKGSTYDQVAKFLGKQIISSFEVVEYKENETITIKSTASSFPIVVTRSVTPTPKGTKVTAVVEGDAGGFFKIAQPLMKLMVKKSVKSDYKKLKKLLEQS